MTVELRVPEVAAACDLVAVARHLAPADLTMTRTALTMTVAAAETSGAAPGLAAVLKAVVLVLAAVEDSDAQEFAQSLDAGIPQDPHHREDNHR